MQIGCRSIERCRLVCHSHGRNPPQALRSSPCIPGAALPLSRDSLRLHKLRPEIRKVHRGTRLGLLPLRQGPNYPLPASTKIPDTTPPVFAWPLITAKNWSALSLSTEVLSNIDTCYVDRLVNIMCENFPRQVNLDNNLGNPSNLWAKNLEPAFYKRS